MIFNMDSTRLIHTPGVLGFCKRMYKHDPKYIMDIMREMKLPDEVSLAYLTGEIGMTVNGGTATLEYDSEATNE